MANISCADHRFFMATALLVAQRSNSSEQVGACIVNDKNQIMGIGYNSAGIHAELNAILKASQGVKNCILYVTLHPCNDCSEMIIQSQMKKVIYNYSKYPDAISPKLLEEYGIACVYYAQRIKLSIDFRNVIETDSDSSGSEDTEEYSRLHWDHFFMGTAYLVAKTNNSAVGACIVNDENQIVSIGFMKTQNQETTVVHAELNAIINASHDVNNCTLYVNVFPCNECATHIIQSRIKKVVYNFDKYPNSTKKLRNFGIQCMHYIPPHNLIID